jgi:hypothetical protein
MTVITMNVAMMTAVAMIVATMAIMTECSINWRLPAEHGNTGDPACYVWVAGTVVEAADTK